MSERRQHTLRLCSKQDLKIASDIGSILLYVDMAYYISGERDYLRRLIRKS